jgi:hypothetical protein
MDEASLAQRALSWLDGWWDPEVGLLRYPSAAGSPTNPYQRPGVHVVRETTTYAVGLLERDAPGDRERAHQALATVLAHQIDDPASVCHGTWRRSPAEPMPGDAPREWVDYDPNWREFIGTALVLALDHAERLPTDFVGEIDTALRRAAEGTLARGVLSEYTNIALMCAFLLDWLGERLGEPSWRVRGVELGRAVAQAYRDAGAFPEHNSPTYYGVDLYGLALWRARAESPELRALGAEIEAALWRDLARFYHAGLRNLCGPYTRAYGMDMTSYVGSLGSWIAPWVDSERAPLPALGDAVDHAHDFGELVLIGCLGSRAPDDVVAALRVFSGERRVQQVISDEPRRVATAWLTDDVMLGGEHTGARSIHWQHHPATIHWRRTDGGVGWLRIVTPAPVDAVAEPGALAVDVHTGLRWLREVEVPVWIEVFPAPDAPLDARDGASWQLDGASIRLSVDPSPAGESAGPSEVGAMRIGWRFAPGEAPRRLALRLVVESSTRDG